MKKIVTILSALLIVMGLKAQKTNVRKETIKPQVDSLIKQTAGKPVNSKTAVQQKEAKIAPALKYAPAIKKAGKQESIQH